MQITGHRFNNVVEVQIELQKLLESFTEKQFQSGFRKLKLGTCVLLCIDRDGVKNLVNKFFY